MGQCVQCTVYYSAQFTSSAHLIVVALEYCWNNIFSIGHTWKIVVFFFFNLLWRLTVKNWADCACSYYALESSLKWWHEVVNRGMNTGKKFYTNTSYRGKSQPLINMSITWFGSSGGKCGFSYIPMYNYFPIYLGAGPVRGY